MNRAIPLLLILVMIAGGVMLILAPHTGEAVAGAWSLDIPWTSPDALLDQLSSIPLSGHAANGHQGQYNAQNLISNFVLRKDCRPILVYACPSQKKVEVMCEIKPGLTGGVIVGYDGDTQIITGYAQQTNRWKHRGCLPPIAIP